MRYLVEAEAAEDNPEAQHLATAGTLVHPRRPEVDAVAPHRHEALERDVHLTHDAGCRGISIRGGVVLLIV